MGLPFEETVSWIDKWEEKQDGPLPKMAKQTYDDSIKIGSASLTDQVADLLVFDC